MHVHICTVYVCVWGVALYEMFKTSYDTLCACYLIQYVCHCTTVCKDVEVSGGYLERLPLLGAGGRGGGGPVGRAGGGPRG